MCLGRTTIAVGLVDGLPWVPARHGQKQEKFGSRGGRPSEVTFGSPGQLFFLKDDKNLEQLSSDMLVHGVVFHIQTLNVCNIYANTLTPVQPP